MFYPPVKGKLFFMTCYFVVLRSGNFIKQLWTFLSFLNIHTESDCWIPGLDLVIRNMKALALSSGDCDIV